jgi:death on curing protein
MNGANPWTRLISADQIIDLHSDLIKRYGGDPTPSVDSVKDGCIERSLGAAWTAELYVGAEDSIPGLCFAGCLLFYLAKNHCFIDGNKRISWAASMQILLGLDLTLDVSELEAEAFCLSILAGDVASATDVSIWMADRLMAIEED